jgi:hypothetical protein
VPVQFDYGPLRLKPNTLPTWLSVPLHIAMWNITINIKTKGVLCVNFDVTS